LSDAVTYSVVMCRRYSGPVLLAVWTLRETGSAGIPVDSSQLGVCIVS
jgi:hypothetical protein